MADELTAARIAEAVQWFKTQAVSGYIDIGFHDTVEWEHLAILADCALDAASRRDATEDTRIARAVEALVDEWKREGDVDEYINRLRYCIDAARRPTEGTDNG